MRSIFKEIMAGFDEMKTHRENQEQEALVLITNTLDDIRIALLAETLRVEQIRMQLLSYSREEEKPEESIRSNHLLLFNLRELLGILMLLSNEGISDSKYLHNLLIKIKNSRLSYSIEHFLDDPKASIGQDSDKPNLSDRIKLQIERLWNIFKAKNITAKFILDSFPSN